MKLTCNQQCDSIAPFGTIEDLPDFMILTGRNGSGKTQLLKAIESGKITINNGNLHSVYFNYQDFKIETEQQINNQQLQQLAQQSWSLFSVKNSHPQKQHLTQIFQQYFNQAKLNEHIEEIKSLEKERMPLCDTIEKLEKDSELSKKWNSYLSNVKRLILQQRQTLKDRRIDAIFDIFQKTPKPIHLLTQEEYIQLYDPSYEGGNFLSSKLAADFLSYLRSKFKYIYNYGDGKLKANVEAEYETKHLPPWRILDEILSDFENFDSINHLYSDLTLDQYSAPTFNYPLPAVNVKNVDNPVPFNKLSSGEQVLLSLAITIYNASKHLIRPDVLLLDEIDATLHPSMIRTLLDTLNRVFVSEGTTVILATHSPSTVALAEESSIAVIHKDPEEINRLGKISHSSQNEALNILTEGFITLKSHDKFVITEANDDADYYQATFDRLVEKRLLNATPSLKFIPASDKDNSGKGGGCNQAKQWTEKLANLPNSNFKCLLDADFEGANPNQSSDNVIALNRSSLENYLYDPLTVLAVIIENGGASQLPSWEDRDACSSQIFDCDSGLLESLIKEIENKFDIPRVNTVALEYDGIGELSVSDRWQKKRGHDLAKNIYSKANSEMKSVFDGKAFSSDHKKNLTVQTTKNINFIPLSLRETFEHIQKAFKDPVI